MYRFLSLFLILLISTSAIFANQQRVIRQIPQSIPSVPSGPIRDDPHRDPVDLIFYDDENALTMYIPMPEGAFGVDDHSYNVRFTPAEAPFRLIGLHVALHDMRGNIGNPGMDVAVFSSNDDGFPDEEIVTFDVPNEDLVFSPSRRVEWNIISFGDYDAEPILFEEVVDFHMVLNVIQGDERDTLAVSLDNAEAAPSDRSGLWNGDLERWDTVLEVYNDGYNFAIRAVVEYPDPEPPAIAIDPLNINMNNGGDFPIMVSNIGEGILEWNTDVEIIAEPEGEDQDWFSWWEPQGGELGPDEEVQVWVTIDAEGAIAGLYEAELHFLSNDFLNPDVSVSIVMEVVEHPRIVVNPLELDFGIVEDPEPRTEILTISNTGNELLIVNDISTNNEVYSIGFERVLEINSQESSEITVTFTPNIPGQHQGIIQISSNDPENNPVLIPVQAVYVTPPTIFIDPLNIESIDGGQYEILLTNEGSLPLEWTTVIGAEWLSINPAEGQNEPWEDATLHVTIDTTGLAPDTYQADITFNSNDPVNPEVATSVSLEVTELGVSNQSAIPQEFGITAIYPNPFNSTATIEFVVVSAGEVSLQIFDMKGQLIRNLISGNRKAAGKYSIIVEADDLPAGIYSIRLQQNHHVQTQSISLIK